MFSPRWAKALAVGALALSSLALVLFVSSVFSRGMHRGMSYDVTEKCRMKGGCQKSMEWQGSMGGDGMMGAGRTLMLDESVTQSAPAFDMAAEPMGMMKSMPAPAVSGTVVSMERQVATVASLELRAKSLDWTVGKVREIAKNSGGFVENASVNQPEQGLRTAWMTVKVPADRFDAAFSEIKQAADQVVNEVTGASDMTAQNIDLNARLNNKRAEEAAYENLLGTAAKVSDVLEITQQLTQVRTEIESIEQQLRYLEGQTALATVSVSVTEDPQVEAKPGEFSRGNVFKSAVNTLVDALLALGSGLVYFLISGLPVLLLILGVLWVVYRVAKRAVEHFFGR